MRQFFLKAGLIYLVFNGLILLLQLTEIIVLPFDLYYFNLGYFLLALYIHSVLIKSSKKSGSQFIIAFMGMVTLKLLLTLAALGIYLYLVKENQAALGIGVFIIYMAYTIYEVLFLQSELRK